MATCPTCGAEAQVGQRFCAECGTKLTAARPRANEGDGSNSAPRRPADIGAGGFRWNASAPTPPSEVVGRAREEAERPTAPSDNDDFFARYRPKATSPSAPDVSEDADGEAAPSVSAPDAQSFLRSRRRFNPDLRATGERDVVAPEAVIPPPPVTPRAPAAAPAAEAQDAAVESPAATPDSVDAPAAPEAPVPVRDAFAFEPPTTEFDVLPMSTPPARSAAAAGGRSGDADESRGQLPSWFSELDGSGDEAPASASAPQAPSEPEAASAPAVPSAPAFGSAPAVPSEPVAPAASPHAAPQFERPPARAADAAPAAPDTSVAPTGAAPSPRAERFSPPVEDFPAPSSPSIPAFRADPPAAPTPRVVPSPPPMPATGDPFRGASAAPVFPTGPAIVPGEPPRTAPAASSAFDELLAGERSDGSVLDDSDRPIVSRDFEQTGIVPLPSRTRESFGGAQESERQDAADLFGASAAPSTPSGQAPQAPSAPEAEPATRALPRHNTGPAFGDDFGQDADFDGGESGADRRGGAAAAGAAAAGVAGAAAASAAPSAPAFGGPSRSAGNQGEPDPAKELLSSWFDEEDSDAQPSAPASAGTRAPRAPRRPGPAARAPGASTTASAPATSPRQQAPVGDEPDLQPSERNPFDRVGAALGGGRGGGGGRVGEAVRSLDNRNRRRLGVIALSVVGSILLILSAIMIGNVVGANRDQPVADEQPAASETVEEQPVTEEPAPPAGPVAVTDPNFAPVSFQSESGNIRCEITPEAGVACQQFTVGFAIPEQVCEAGATGVVVGIDSNGYTFPCRDTDIEGGVVQPYNTPVVVGEFVCEIDLNTGVTCFNASSDIVSVEYSLGIGQAGRLSETNPTPAEGQ